MCVRDFRGQEANGLPSSALHSFVSLRYGGFPGAPRTPLRDAEALVSHPRGRSPRGERGRSSGQSPGPRSGPGRPARREHSPAAAPRPGPRTGPGAEAPRVANGNKRLLPEAAAEGRTWTWVWAAWEKTLLLPASGEAAAGRVGRRRPRPAGAGCRRPPAQAWHPAATRGCALPVTRRQPRRAAAEAAPAHPPSPREESAAWAGPAWGCPNPSWSPPQLPPPPRAGGRLLAQRLSTAGGERAAAAPAGGGLRRALPGRPCWGERPPYGGAERPSGRGPAGAVCPRQHPSN